MDNQIKKILECLDDLRGSKLPFIFAYLEQIKEDEVTVDSAYGGTYDQGILMLVTLMTHLHQITGSSYFEIFFDMGSQLAVTEIKRSDGKCDEAPRRILTEEEIKEKVITFLKPKKNDKKPDK